MNRFIFSMIFLTTLLFSWEFEEKSPLELDIQITSPDKLSSVSLYTSTILVEEGEMKHQYIKISTLNRTWWLSSIDPTGTIIEKIEFIDNSNFIIVQGSFTVSSTSIMNIDTNNMSIIGGGDAKYNSYGPNNGLFLVSDVKRYLPEGGAYWVDELRDKNGNLIEVLSKPKNEWGCIQLSTILDTSKKYIYLRQNLSDCIYVER